MVKVGDYVYDTGRKHPQYKGDIGVVIRYDGYEYFVKWLATKDGDVGMVNNYEKERFRKEFIIIPEREAVLEVL